MKNFISNHLIIIKKAISYFQFFLKYPKMLKHVIGNFLKHQKKIYSFNMMVLSIYLIKIFKMEIIQ